MSDAGLKACAAAFGIASLGGVDQPSVKAILTFRPDLIVGFPGDPATRRPGDPATRRPGDPALAAAIYPSVSQIAPPLSPGAVCIHRNQIMAQAKMNEAHEGGKGFFTS